MIGISRIACKFEGRHYCLDVQKNGDQSDGQVYFGSWVVGGAGKLFSDEICPKYKACQDDK